MASLNINDILRAGDVKRWTIVRTAVQQSLAEHTFNVVMIARAICAKLGVDDHAVTKYALEHDLDEIRTGDVPTPEKERSNWDLPHGGNNTPDLETYHIVKCADVIEAHWFIIENGVGRHALEVERYLAKKIDRIIGSAPDDIGAAATQVMHDIYSKEYNI